LGADRSLPGHDLQPSHLGVADGYGHSAGTGQTDHRVPRPGLKSDTPEQRAERIRDHNTIWGPFGRNLHEDLLGVHGQGLAMREGSDSKWVLHGREENSTIHDEVGMRHFYAEWSKRMGRKAYDPFNDNKLA